MPGGARSGSCAWLRRRYPERPTWHLARQAISQALYDPSVPLQRTAGQCLRTPRPPSPAATQSARQDRPPCPDAPAAGPAGRRRGSQRGRALGGRLDHRNREPVRDRHAGGADEPLRTAGPPPGPTHGPGHVQRRGGRAEPTAGRAPQVVDMGPGHRDGRPRVDHRADRTCPSSSATLRSPWQRPTNENSNGLLRDYFPKGTDLARHSPADLQAVQDQLNNRPRKCLQWRTPTEVFAELQSAPQ